MSDEALSYDEVLARIAALAEELIGHPDPVVAERVTELLDWIDAFHRDGLGQLVEMIRAWRGEIFLENAAADATVGTLLRAYGLGEGDVTDERACGRLTDEAVGRTAAELLASDDEYLREFLYMTLPPW